jgi:hypothetical protein
MWRRLKNQFISLKAYAEVSPDLGQRRRVNQALRSRPHRSFDESYRAFWQPLSISREIATFVYQSMERYSGLQFANVLPKDRLTEDLKLPLVCWFDWECVLCEDFSDRFGVEIYDRFDVEQLATVEDLVIFLNQQVLLLNPQ